MRENHLQTPQRDPSLANRRGKSNPDSSKSSNKIVRKNLNAEFSEASGEVSAVATPNNSITEISDDNIIIKSVESFVDSSDPVNMPLSLVDSSSDLTSSSTITTSGTKGEGTGQIVESKSLTITSVKSELVVEQLKEAMGQVLTSKDVHARSKKILDVAVNVLIEDLHGIHISDNNWFNHQTSMKAFVVLLNFACILSSIWFVVSGNQRAPFGPTPT
ncbi:hypothetical protein LIER_05526 [Lithospermum erythrorhizon]|uniref:Uncharacterized protein n=1 Tax=Lithospermum erythrorhizon TaxID=34254 RepID=A0AAV3P117_LITER